MVNAEDFIKRLEILLEYYSLNASSFADKIGVQRSSLSHLLSGRNKPSLDFVMKISEEFADIDLYWLLNGKGSMLKNAAASEEKITAQKPQENFENAESVTTDKSVSTTNHLPYSEIPNTEQIEKIVVFYKNGTFKNYIPK
ncbi:helix-turn-helix domain-containing protein [Flavobacterium sp. 3HN19-14]|uniref:helix-turn-helix domain-containing protein n=1 Tax=Flavobacterium sp. 3HN19-14 TaxID=3448133 RepID=UPI003EE279CF